MKVIVKARHMQLTEALKNYVSDKLSNALMRVFDRPAAAMDIELNDLGHLHNCTDKECKVVLHMPHGKTIVIREVDNDMYKAIHLAHDRLLEQVKRQQEKRRHHSKLRKMAVHMRAKIAESAFTSPKETWERELWAYEHSAHSPTYYAI